MKVFKMIFEEQDDSQGTFGWAFTNNPATDTEAVFLSKDTEAVELSLEDEQQIMYAVGLVPEQVITRRKKGGEKYGIVFPAETVKLVSQNYMSRAGTSTFNLEHSIPIEGAKVVESWVVRDEAMDKAKSIGLTAPKDSWVLGFKVADKDNWKALKESNITSISMEGLFRREEIEAIELAAQPTDDIKEVFNLIEDFISDKS